MLTNISKKIFLFPPSNKRGFSLMEIIVVLAMFSFGLVGISSLMLMTMRAESLNAGYLKASLFAQEGLELVRGYRDENWLNSSLPDWDDNFGGTDRTFTIYYGDSITTNDVASINDSDTILRYNGNFYDHVAGGAPSTYRRLITVSDCTPSSSDCWEVESRVNWVTSGKSNDYIAKTLLYNWR
ncbi:MAG: type II secretion system protein [Patescibacteria group bacterium]|jgi:prepilin-type N-terminal cleavage/methylation domain-containing protein|nr:type II secretion system protein [Patescibacteria group bacterium]